jgi:hypothetical protein
MLSEEIQFQQVAKIGGFAGFIGIPNRRVNGNCPFWDESEYCVIRNRGVSPND